jgi:hypothetical protein
VSAGGSGPASIARWATVGSVRSFRLSSHVRCADGEGGLNPWQTVAHPLLTDDFISPLNERDKDGRVGKAGMFACKIGFLDPTGLRTGPSDMNGDV